MKFRNVLLIFLLVALNLMFAVGCSAEKNTIQNAKKRVTEVLNGILETRTNAEVAEERSICRWAKDVLTPLSIPYFGRACDQFDRWRQEANIYPTIQSFTVTNGYLVEGVNPPTVMVEGTINGVHFKMRVPDNDQISWEQIPQFEDIEQY
jgi:hypothetical protein